MGGAGYIGSHVVRHLHNKGYDCVVADNLTYGHREAVPAGMPFIKADLLDKDGLGVVFKSYPIDAVMHFAGLIFVGESVIDPQKYYLNNVAGTMNLLDAMLKHDVKKIVFSSSCAIYGEPLYTAIDEQHPQSPINPYGHSKQMIEQVLADHQKAYGLQYVALRYFNAAGASKDGELGESHNPETHLIPLVLKAITGERDCIKVFGTDYDTPDGTCIRDYIHVEDLAGAHRLALEKLGQYNGYINLGTGLGVSVKEIIGAAEKVSGKKCPVKYAARRAGDAAVLRADNAKAKNVLGWQPAYLQVEDIIETALNWELNKKY